MATPDASPARARSRQSSDSSLTTFYTSVEISDQDQDRDLDGGGDMTTATSTNTSTGTTEEEKAEDGGYRAAGRMQVDLAEHCRILLDEQIFTSAIHLLNSMLGAGTSRRQPTQKPAPIPPPNHLALLATITVHPLQTTRAEKLEHADVAGRALAYLRSVLEAVGPIQADFRTAFQFRDPSRRRRPPAQDSDGEQVSAGSDMEPDLITCRMANEGSVWEQGKDFWGTVGWAFRCSTAMPHRWRYWRAWLDFMLDVLEADWAERERMDEEALAERERIDKEALAAGGAGEDGKEKRKKREKKKKEQEMEGPTAARKESMMAVYMGEKQMTQIVKALLVYGGSEAATSYSEVFEKEHRGPRRPPLSVVGKRKRDRNRERDQELDVANGRFGDYLDDEGLSSGISEPPTPRKPRARRDGDVLGAGMAESVGLRLRLFKLVSAVVFTTRHPDRLHLLYRDFAAAVAALPVDVFAAVATQRPNALLLATHVTLTRELFERLLPGTMKQSQRVDPETDRIGGLSPAMLEECYAGRAANGAEAEKNAKANAKVSLLVESAVQLLWGCGGLTDGERVDGLAQAVERGIKAREDKVGRRTMRGKGKADSADEGSAAEVLRLSGERLRVLMGVLGSEE